MDESKADEHYDDPKHYFKDNAFSPEPVYTCPDQEPIQVCKCLLASDPSEEIEISERKKMLLSTVARTEAYLRERRIPELIRFLLTKVVANGSKNPIEYLEKLLDDCMLFRAGHTTAPVLYKIKHLQAVIKSFDPGQRGWLTAGQVRRACTTLGLTPPETLEERMSCDEVLNTLETIQEQELSDLISAGLVEEKSAPTPSSSLSAFNTKIN